MHTPGWRVEITEDGRSGTVHYLEAPSNRIPFYWEFGGAEDIVVILSFEADETKWNAQYPWAAGRRAEIVQRVAAETIRQKSPASFPEIDFARGWIHVRSIRSATPKPTQKKSSMFATAAVVGLLIAFAGLLGYRSLLVATRTTPGTPIGLSVRTPQHIATLLQTQEPYLPSLHRDPSNDRFQLSLLLTPIDKDAKAEVVPLAKDLRATDFHFVKLYGCDGETVWFRFLDLGGVQLRSRKRLTPADLRRANPSMPSAMWEDTRQFEFAEDRLRVAAMPERSAYVITPQTLQAVPAPEVARRPAQRISDPVAQDFLTAGTPVGEGDRWLGLLTAKDAETHYRVHSGMLNGNPQATYANAEPRRFHVAQLGPAEERGRREILSIAPVAPQEYRNAAFVRSGPDDSSPVLRLASSPGGGFLFVFTMNGGLMLGRVDPRGTVAWTLDTGLDRFKLQQILPGARSIAFIGSRPPVPDKLSEPILVIVDVESKSVSTRSLWQ